MESSVIRFYFPTFPFIQCQGRKVTKYHTKTRCLLMCCKRKWICFTKVIGMKCTLFYVSLNYWTVVSLLKIHCCTPKFEFKWNEVLNESRWRLMDITGVFINKVSVVNNPLQDSNWDTMVNCNSCSNYVNSCIRIQTSKIFRLWPTKNVQRYFFLR